MVEQVTFRPVGLIRTPYKDWAPHQPVEGEDETPLLDIKPYFPQVDAKVDANSGWAEDLHDRDHTFRHLRGLPHDHG